jgi:hypothetical protein
MRASLVLLAATALGGCSGHAATPAGAPAPAVRPAGDPTTVRYTPTTGHYRYEQSLNSHQEAMGQVQEIAATTSMLISAAVTPGDSGRLNAAFTVDSVTAISNGATSSALDVLRGKIFRSVFSAMGRPLGFTSPDTSLASVQSGEMFREFLPTLPSGLAVGTTWTDTATSPPTSIQGMTVRTQSVRTHRVVGWETREGARTLHIATTGQYTISGEGEQGGAQLQLAGTGQATSDRYISAAGVYLGAITGDSTNVTVTVLSMGLEVPVRQVRHTTMTRLP